MPERAAARSFGDRMVWREAHEFVLAVYGFTETYPERGQIGAGTPAMLWSMTSD